MGLPSWQLVKRWRLPYRPRISPLTSALTEPQGTLVKGLRRVLPTAVIERIRSVIAYPATFKLTSDLKSFRQLRRLENRTVRWSSDVDRVELRVKPLGDRTISLRPRSTDTNVLRQTFLEKSHLPPQEVADHGPRIIWDLGSNVGLTIAHMAILFPEARIVGVELDRGNAVLGRHNIRPWIDRCVIIEAAVWPTDGEVAYVESPGDEYGLRVSSAPGDQTRTHRVPARSLNTLFAAHTPDGEIDYVKVDIEGAERDLLKRNTEWAARVRAISVEVHDEYSLEECSEDLRSLGFHTRIYYTTEHGPVAGVRA